MPVRALLGFLAAACVGSTLSLGCARTQSGETAGHALPPTAESPQRAETVADWDDVEPAVTAALGQTDLVKARIERPSDDRIEFSLWSVYDQPGLLVVTRDPRPDTAAPVPIELTCTVGRFGDPAREAELLALVVRRLGQLKGVEVAPLDW